MCESHLTKDQCESYYEKKAQHMSMEYQNGEWSNIPYGCMRKKDDVGSVVIQFNTYNLAQYNSNSLKHIPCGRDGVECICLKKGMYNE